MHIKNLLGIFDFFSENFEEKKNSDFGQICKIFQKIKSIGRQYNYDSFLLFMIFDIEHKGYIVVEDFFKTLKEIQPELTLKEISDFFEKVDLRLEKKVSLADFVYFMENFENL